MADGKLELTVEAAATAAADGHACFFIKGMRTRGWRSRLVTLASSIPGGYSVCSHCLRLHRLPRKRCDVCSPLPSYRVAGGLGERVARQGRDQEAIKAAVAEQQERTDTEYLDLGWMPPEQVAVLRYNANWRWWNPATWFQPTAPAGGRQRVMRVDESGPGDHSSDVNGDRAPSVTIASTSELVPASLETTIRTLLVGNLPFVAMVLGAAGTGKSTMTRHLLETVHSTRRGGYSHLFVVTTSASDISLYQSVARKKQIVLYDQLSSADQKSLVKKITHTARQYFDLCGERTALWVDDLTSEIEDGVIDLRDAVTKGRHAGLDTYINHHGMMKNGVHGKTVRKAARIVMVMDPTLIPAMTRDSWCGADGSGMTQRRMDIEAHAKSLVQSKFDAVAVVQERNGEQSINNFVFSCRAPADQPIVKDGLIGREAFHTDGFLLELDEQAEAPMRTLKRIRPVEDVGHRPQSRSRRRPRHTNRSG